MEALNIHNVNSANKTIEYIESNGVNIALHSWIPTKVRAILFYIHGIQSHAQWSHEMAMQMNQASIAVFILDRRGSGLSGGLRGDIPTTEILLTDYYLVLQKIRDKYPTIPLTLMGHSLGGSILAGLLSWPEFDIHYNSIVFCASALGKLHHQLTASDHVNLLNNQSLELYELNLNNYDYTDDPDYLAFINQDKLCCRTITQRTRSVLLEIEKLYWKKTVLKENIPSIFVYPQTDPLVNIDNALSVFMEFSNYQGMTLQIPANKHYMWFTKQKYLLTNWLIHYVLTEGYRNYDYS